MGELGGRRVVITGGAGRIARETAKLLLAESAELLLIDANQAALDRLTAELEDNLFRSNQNIRPAP